MKVKELNLKNMKETLVNYSHDQEEFGIIWNGFYQMANLGFISRETWIKFANQCRGWYYDEYSDCIMDELHCTEGVDSVVWKYTPDAEYHA